MSVSLWRWTDSCEYQYCCGNCDKCNKEYEPEKED